MPSCTARWLIDISTGDSGPYGEASGVVVLAFATAVRLSDAAADGPARAGGVRVGEQVTKTSDEADEAAAVARMVC